MGEQEKDIPHPESEFLDGQPLLSLYLNKDLRATFHYTWGGTVNFLFLDTINEAYSVYRNMQFEHTLSQAFSQSQTFSSWLPIPNREGFVNMLIAFGYEMGEKISDNGRLTWTLDQLFKESVELKFLEKERLYDPTFPLLAKQLMSIGLKWGSLIREKKESNARYSVPPIYRDFIEEINFSGI